MKKPKVTAKKNGHLPNKKASSGFVYELGDFGDEKRTSKKLPDLAKIARKNVGGRDRFKNVTAYRFAIRDEMARLKKTNTNRDLLEDVGGEITESVIIRQPPAYRKEFAEVARLICSLYGSSVLELAKFFNCPGDQIKMWIKIHPEFDRAVNDRSTEMNVKIMGRLARRASGFYADTEKVFYDVKRGTVVKVPTQEYYPPSENAIFFWLKNRMPEHWKDVKDVNIDENRKVVMEIYKNFETLTQEQATDAYQELLKIESPGVQLRTPASTEAEAQAKAASGPRRGPVTDIVEE